MANEEVVLDIEELSVTEKLILLRQNYTGNSAELFDGKTLVRGLDPLDSVLTICSSCGVRGEIPDDLGTAARLSFEALTGECMEKTFAALILENIASMPDDKGTLIIDVARLKIKQAVKARDVKVMIEAFGPFRYNLAEFSGLVELIGTEGVKKLQSVTDAFNIRAISTRDIWLLPSSDDIEILFYRIESVADIALTAYMAISIVVALYAVYLSTKTNPSFLLFGIFSGLSILFQTPRFKYLNKRREMRLISSFFMGVANITFAFHEWKFAFGMACAIISISICGDLIKWFNSRKNTIPPQDVNLPWASVRIWDEYFSVIVDACGNAVLQIIIFFLLIFTPGTKIYMF